MENSQEFRELRWTPSGGRPPIALKDLGDNHLDNLIKWSALEAERCEDRVESRTMFDFARGDRWPIEVEKIIKEAKYLWIWHERFKQERKIRDSERIPPIDNPERVSMVWAGAPEEDKPLRPRKRLVRKRK